MAGYLFVILFSWTYWDYSAQPGSCMNVALTKTDSVYFTLTTLTTVGYGDIVPVTEHCRMIVSAQMAGGLIFGAILLALLVARIAARSPR
jgi:voltage-gated potassium channel Kch